jgi:hypothetical protein
MANETAATREAARRKLAEEEVLAEIEHFRAVERTVLVHVGALDAEEEWLDRQLGEQSHSGSGHPLSLLDQVHSVDDLNSTTGDLRGDVQRLEEGGLPRVQRSWARWDVHIQGGERATAGRCWHLVQGDFLADLRQIVVGEAKSDVAVNFGEHCFKAFVATSLDVVTENTTNDGVLAHQKHCFATKSNADLLHLSRSDVVDVQEQDVLVLGDEAQETLPIVQLALAAGVDTSITTSLLFFVGFNLGFFVVAHFEEKGAVATIV